MSDLERWLEGLGLGRYAKLFAEHDIDCDVLPDLTEQDLEKLGISLGHRKKLLRAVVTLAEAEPATTAPAIVAREAERRQLTVMFVDLVGSTALSARFDPEDMSTIIRTYQNAVAGEIMRFEGHIAKYMGDGVLAYFGYPKAHEDEAERAVRAALALADAVGKLVTPADEPIAARIGIATGLVVVGELIGEGSSEEQAVVGETPNLAARLQALAEPGCVVIAASTRRLLGELFELADLGTHDLKGFAEPVAALAVRGERTTASRFEARSGPSLLPMVGRDQELALLLERWALAKAGEGQGVLLVGEAGIGKSRISRALLDALAEEPHTRVRYQCSPYHTDSALWPVIQQLSHAAGLGTDDPVDAGLDKLEALLDRAGGHDAAPLMAGLIGLDGATRYGPLDLTPQAQRTRTLGALVEQLLGLAARQPVLLVLEDSHWIDPTTLELIEQCLERIAAARVLVLLTTRPDQQPDLTAHPRVTRLTLNRLGRAGVEAIVDGVGGSHLLNETIGTIIARTDGVPLFVEELTKAILETGEATIPASLHDSLMARLDRIPDVKEVAQMAACIGRTFDHPLLAAIAEKPELELTAALAKLAAAELIFRRGTPPEATYSFKHALVQDAAYQSLLKSRRQQMHARIAETLETGFPAVVEAEPEVVAHHLSAAGDAERAIGYWRAAARRASGRSAYRESVAFFDQALASLDQIAESDDTKRLAVDIRLDLRPALGALGEYGRILERHREAQHYAESIDDRQRLARIEADLPLVLYQLGHTSEAIAVGDRARRLAAEVGDRRALIQATFNFGMAHFFAGHYRRAVDIMLEYADDLKGPLRHERLGSTGTSACNWLGNIAGAYARLGEFDQAIAYAEEAVQIAHETDRPFDMCIASLWLGTTHVVKGEAERAVASFDRMLRLARENELGFILAWVGLGIAESYRLLGKASEASAILAESLASAKRFKLAIAEEWSVLGMCNVHLATGSVEDAIDCGRHALETAQSRGYPWCEGVALRLLGAAYAQLGPEHFDQAERCLTGARSRAGDLQARPELAHACREQGVFLAIADRLPEAQSCFTQAIDLYRTMGMTSWLAETESLLDQSTAERDAQPGNAAKVR